MWSGRGERDASESIISPPCISIMSFGHSLLLLLFAFVKCRWDQLQGFTDISVVNKKTCLSFYYL